MTTTTTNDPSAPVASGPSRGRSSSAHDRFSQFGTTAVLGIAGLYFILPIWWLFVSSTKTQGDLFATNGFLFEGWNLLGNIGHVFAKENGAFIGWMGNSLIYAGAGGIVATMFGAACGYAIAKFNFPGRGVVFASIIAGVLVPSALLTIPLYLMFSAIGVINTYWAVLIPAVVSPFAVYLSRIYATASIPDEVIEAARMDGAGELRIFFTISLRIMSPALITVFLFSFVGIWNNFFLPLVMLKDSSFFPVTLGLFNWFNRNNQVPYTDVITGSFLSVIPLIIAFVALQRFWRAGLTAGAVKA